MTKYENYSIDPSLFGRDRLKRDDQWQAWERIHGSGAQGMSRRVSVGRHPQLDFLQEQVSFFPCPVHRFLLLI
jgi:hypothetical protein